MSSHYQWKRFLLKIIKRKRKKNLPCWVWERLEAGFGTEWHYKAQHCLWHASLLQCPILMGGNSQILNLNTQKKTKIYQICEVGNFCTMRIYIYTHICRYKYLPERRERRRRSQRLRNSQWRLDLRPSLLTMWSRNDNGVTGCIFHCSVDSTKSSIFCTVLASNTYFVSFTWSKTTPKS